MKIQEILNSTDHRPWKIPNENWKLYQEWNDTLFLHWQVDLSELQKFVPEELEIDLFEGKPWISIVAFSMEKIRPKNLPSFPPISNFAELNIRTYVKSNNKAGVYFLSIEGGKSLSCKIAEAISELPYRFSQIKRSDNLFECNNSEFNDELKIEFKVGKEITEKSDLDKWLTERYALFHDTKTSINEFEIHHMEWPIREITLDSLVFNYPRFKNLIKDGPHKIQYSKGVQVLTFGKHKKDKTSYKR